jgi:hypothetical protein
MQNTDPESEQFGAFHYSFFTTHQRKDRVYPVGTAAKTIFTLLELHDRTGEDHYREAVVRAADWLLRMVGPRGDIRPFARWEDGRWWYVHRKSLLFEGQVLSALSRLYGYTGRDAYLRAARKIARRFAVLVETEGTYLGDDYRAPNPISSSWVLLSLLDFHKVTGNQYYRDVVFQIADDLLERQVRDTGNILGFGRWPGALSTSGNGWLMEVFSELFLFCRGKDFGRPAQYKGAVLKGARWVLERTYRPANAFLIPNPKRATGGLFWNRSKRYVRTDSVCHGLNALINVSPHVDREDLIRVPESPVQKRLGLDAGERQ